MSHYASLPALSDGGLSRYLDEVNRFPMLGEKEEYMLAKALVKHGDVKAAEKLVTSHLRLVVKVAMGFRGYGLPLVELISEGNVGLLQAVKRFDPEKGFRLSTYALWWIKASINEYILRSWSLVKMGTTAAQKKLFFNLRRLKQHITGVDDRDLSPKEVEQVARTLNVPERDVVEMDQRLGSHDASLNASFSDESDTEWVDCLEDYSTNQEVIVVERDDLNHRKQLMLEAMESLNEREQAIIQARRLTEEPATLEELSQTYGVSRERVRQIEARALEKLQAFVQPE